MSDDIVRRFSDDQARAILARASEIDARAPMTTTDDLRAIAAEIGVSQASLDAALREQTTALEQRRTTGSERTATLIAASGVPLGVAAGSLLAIGGLTAGTGLAALGIMGLGFLASGALIVFQGSAGTLRSFHVKNLALWSGVAAGSLLSIVLAEGGATSVPALVTVGWCLRSWLASGVLGSAAVLAVRRARPPQGPEPDAHAAEAFEDAHDRHWARVAKRVLRRITGALRWDAGRVGLAHR